MSLAATRFRNCFRTTSTTRSSSLEEALFEEGYSYDGNFLQEISSPALPRNATDEDLHYLRHLFWHEGVRGQELKKEINSLNLTKGGKKILHEAVRDYNSLPIEDYVAKYHFKKKIIKWQANDAKNDFEISQPLMDCGYWNDNTTFKKEADFLWEKGVRWVEDAIRVYKLLPHVWVKGRSWESPYQINADQLVLVATNPNYRNLPIWAKAQIIKGNHASSRPGDVWRTLMPALKAWKWNQSIPKKFAKRLGEMSPKHRALGAIAWEASREGSWETNGEALPDQKSGFWQKFQSFCQNPEEAVKFLLFGVRRDGYLYYVFTDTYVRNKTLELLWGLPHRFLDGRSFNDITEKEAVELIQKYGGGSAAVCRTLFGCGGKQIQRLFRASSLDQSKWAQALAFGKEDLVQKYLASECVPYQEEAVPFLKFLGEKPARRMVQTTKMTIRGKLQDVTKDYIRDTGYLFSELQKADVSPQLGRVRCWFSTHEVLAKEYIKILPDFELRVNPDFAPLDGLCSVDMVWELEIPKHQHQLKRYGEILSHCVGGYGAAINRGNSVIVAVYFNGILKYTLEFNQEGNHKYRCNQFYGYQNSHPESGDRAVVIDMFKQAKLI